MIPILKNHGIVLDSSINPIRLLRRKTGWGLISEISKHELLMEDANSLASEIVKQPPDAKKK